MSDFIAQAQGVPDLPSGPATRWMEWLSDEPPPFNGVRAVLFTAAGTYAFEDSLGTQMSLTAYVGMILPICPAFYVSGDTSVYALG